MAHIAYPDLSHYNWPISLDGTPFAMFKATEGSSYVDPHYADYVVSAAARRMPYAAYHFLHAGDTAGQAVNAFHVVGPSVPLMVDVEVPASGGPGPTLNDVLSFVDIYRARGGKVTCVYLPRWYWSGYLHGQSLLPLAALDLFLVSSQYTTYSDTGPGWEPYGGMTPKVWQYTNGGLLHGKSVDYNAFRGTAPELSALMNGDDVTTQAEFDALLLGGLAKRWFLQLRQGVDPELPDFHTYGLAQIKEQLDRIEGLLTILRGVAGAYEVTGHFDLTQSPATATMSAGPPPAAVSTVDSQAASQESPES